MVFSGARDARRVLRVLPQAARLLEDLWISGAGRSAKEGLLPERAEAGARPGATVGSRRALTSAGSVLALSIGGASAAQIERSSGGERVLFGCQARDHGRALLHRNEPHP